MALSKWYLCGAEGFFEKDEASAREFAEKAAAKGLVSAEFAVGYYCEVGVAGKKDLEQATSWYNKVRQSSCRTILSSIWIWCIGCKSWKR